MGASGWQYPETVLEEMIIKGKGLIETKPLHHGKADGISQGEVLILVLQDDGLASLFILLARPDHRHGQGSQPIAGHLGTQPGEDQGMGLDHQDVGREDSSLFCGQPYPVRWAAALLASPRSTKA